MPELKLSEDSVLLAFVDRLITEKGLNLDPQAQKSARVALKAQLDNIIEEAMLAALPEEQLLTLEEKVEAGASDAEIEEIFAAANIDYDKVAKETLEAFQAGVESGAIAIPGVVQPATEPTVPIEQPAEVSAEPVTAPTAPVVQQPVVEPTVPAVQPVTLVEQPTVPAVQPTAPVVQQPQMVDQSTMTSQNTQNTQMQTEENM